MEITTGNNILIGFDAIMGVEMESPIAPQLLTLLHQKGLFYWAQVIKEWKDVITQWKLNRELGLEGTMAAEWNKIIWTMKNAGIYKTEDRDKMIWQVKKGRSDVLVRDIYLSLIEQRRETSHKLFPYSLWKVGCPLKIILFSWLVYHNKNLTWANLQKKSWHGLAICIICLSNTEDNMHNFLRCPLTQSLWKWMASYFGFLETSHTSIIDAYEWWDSQKIVWRSTLLIVIWYIWKWRNKRIFQNSKEEFGHIFVKVIPFYYLVLPNIPLQMKHQNTVSDSQQLFFARAHFDEAAKEGKCPCGVYIGISSELQYFMFWNGGNGTNNKAEAMALHGLLLFCIFMDIGPINIYGDSKIIIEHVKGNQAIKNDRLSGWLGRINSLWKPALFPITHIKRVQNEQADELSKKGMQSPYGKWHLSISVESTTYVIQRFSMPGI